MSAIVQFPTPTTFRNLADPTQSTDGATKSYVDSAISSGAATPNLTILSISSEYGTVNTSVHLTANIYFDESSGLKVKSEGSGNVFITNTKVANVIVQNTAPSGVYPGQLWMDSDYGILSVNVGTDYSNVVWIEVA